MDKNSRKIIFEQLIPVFSQPKMRLDINKFKEYLDYTFNNDIDISYEEFLGSGIKFQLPTMEHIEQVVNVVSKVKSLFLGGVLKRK
jgi:hypothetical protein